MAPGDLPQPFPCSHSLIFIYNTLINKKFPTYIFDCITTTTSSSSSSDSSKASRKQDDLVEEDYGEDDEGEEGIPLPPSSRSLKQRQGDYDHSDSDSDHKKQPDKGSGGTAGTSPRRFRALRAFLRRLLGG